MAGTGRHGGGLAEELDLDAGAGKVTVAQQPDQATPAEGGDDRAPRRSIERHDGQAHGRPLVHEEVEELGRLDPLGDRRHRHVLGGQERAPELPTPDVGQGHDDAVSGRQPVPR